MTHQLVSQPDHGDSIIHVTNGRGVASPRLQIFFDDITSILAELSDSGGGGAIEPSTFDPSSVIYRPSTGSSILPAVVGESEFLGRLPGGEIQGLGFANAWSILGNGTTHVTINDAGNPNDFTVESNASSRMFQVQGSANRVSVSPNGLAGTDGTFHIINKSAGVVGAAADGSTLVLEDEFEGGLSILNGANSTGNLYFGAPSYGEKAGNLWFWHDTDFNLPRMGFDVREKTYLEIRDTQGAVFNPNQDTDIDFEVSTLNVAKFLKVDSSGDRLGITDSLLDPAHGLLHITRASTFGGAGYSGFDGAVIENFSHIVMESDGLCGMTFLAGTGQYSGFMWGDQLGITARPRQLAIVGKPNYNLTTKGQLEFRVDDSNASRMWITSTEVIVNPEVASPTDFRVIGIATTPLLFCDTGSNGVSMTDGTETWTQGILHLIRTTRSGVTANSLASSLVVDSTADNGISFLGGLTTVQSIMFGNATSNQQASIKYDNATSQFTFYTNQTVNGFSLRNGVGVVFNEGGVSTHNFRIETTSSTHMAYVDGALDRFGVSNASLAPTDGLAHFQKSGTAGVVTASTLADGVVIESNADTGLSILVPNDGSTANLYFGAPTSGNNVGRVSMVPSTGVMTITADQVNHSNNIGFAGRLDANTTTVTGTTHTAADEHVILVDDDTAGAAVTVTLPTAATADTIYHIKKLGSTANVTVDGNGAETIDGATTAVLTIQYESITVISDGSAWWVL